MATTNITETLERVQAALTQYKAVKRLHGSVDMITPQLLSGQIYDQVAVMVSY
jgi:hypothetical protein